jgi:ADP-ribose pyrophosphatase
MKQKLINIEPITKNKWLNMFRAQFVNSKDNVVNWIFVSRKKDPIKDKLIDAVVIVPIVDTPEGKRLVITKEYRVTMGDFEYGFPAGLIDPGEKYTETAARELTEETGLTVKKYLGESNILYSSPGITDEHSIMIFVEAEGKISNKRQESSEDIETFLYDIKDIQNLLVSSKLVGAKAWGILYHYSEIGKIE